MKSYEVLQVPGGSALFQRVFTRLGCNGRPPRFRVEFYPYSSLVLTIRRREEAMYVRFSDLLQRAPLPVLEGGAALLLCCMGLMSTFEKDLAPLEWLQRQVNAPSAGGFVGHAFYQYGLRYVGKLGAAIVLGARRGGVLLPVLVLPLATPVLIFGTLAADAAGFGLSPRPHLLLLGAFLAASLPLCPVAAGAALRAAVD